MGDSSHRLFEVSRIERLVQKLALAAREIGGRVRGAVEKPFGGEEAFDADWTARMQAARADADLGAESEAVAVGHASAGVVEDAGAVDFPEESRRRVAYKQTSSKY